MGSPRRPVRTAAAAAHRRHRLRRRLGRGRVRARRAEALIAARAALGFFGAMLMPSTLSLLRSIFTEPRPAPPGDRDLGGRLRGGRRPRPARRRRPARALRLGLGVPARGAGARAAADPRAAPRAREPRPEPGPIDLGRASLLSLATMVPIVYAIKSLADARASTRSASLGDRRRRRLRRALRAPPARAARRRCSTCALFRRGVVQRRRCWSTCSASSRSSASSSSSRSTCSSSSGSRPLEAGLALVPGPRRDDRRRPRRRADRHAASRRASSSRPRSLLSAVGYLLVARQRGRPESLRARRRVAFVLARPRHRRGRDGLERADPRERARRQGRRGLAPSPRPPTSSARCSARRSLGRILTASTGRTRAARRASTPRRRSGAGETLGGAVAVAGRAARRLRGERSRDRRPGVRRGRRLVGLASAPSSCVVAAAVGACRLGG